MPKEEMLTVPEAAQFLGIRPWTMRHWIADRKIEIVKYGEGAVRIKRTVLERFVASSTIKAKASDGRRTTKSRLLEGTRLGRDDEPLAG